MNAYKHTWGLAGAALILFAAGGSSTVFAQGGLGGYGGRGGGLGGLGGGRSGYAGPLDMLATPPTSGYGFGARAFDYGTGSYGSYGSYGAGSYGLGFPYSSYGLANPYVPGGGYFYGMPQRLAPDHRARFRVRVPAANAEVWLEGKKMTQTGQVRDFYSPPLETGYRYTYRVRARWLDNGKQMDQTRTIQVRPDGQSELDFSRPPTS